MIEKQKMLSGKLYNPDSSILRDERLAAKRLCFQYNNAVPESIGKRYDIIKKLFGQCGEKYTIEPNFQCDYGYNIKIGENFYSNYNLVILDSAPVTFGNNVFIGPNCGFYTPEHPIDSKERAIGLEYARPINVGDNVWIGGSVTVLSGVTIGDNVVIGAGSVVTKNIPPNTVAVGNPCKVIKHIS